MNDPIGDMLTRIRNSQMRGKSTVITPASKLRARVLDVLADEGSVLTGVTIDDLKAGTPLPTARGLTLREVEEALRSSELLRKMRAKPGTGNGEVNGRQLCAGEAGASQALVESPGGPPAEAQGKLRLVEEGDR